MSTLPEKEPVLGRAQVIRAAGIVSVAFVFSRLLGFVRFAVIGFYYGTTSAEVNAYQIANRVPETIFIIMAGGALGSAFIPTFAGYFAREDPEGGWRLFSAIINLVLVTLTILCGVVALAARPLLILYLPELANQPEMLAMTTALLRVLLFSTVIFGVSGVFMGALNARQHFLLPAIAPIIYNLGIIGGAVLLAPESQAEAWPNILGPAWGAVAGAAGHLLIQVPGLRQHGVVYSPILTLRDKGVQQVLRLMAPRILGLSFSQINNLIIPALAPTLLIVASFDFAWRIVLMPQSILGQALGIAAFPTFATLAAQMDLPQMRRILADTLRLILFIGLPGTILLMVLNEPLVMIAFERGAFGEGDTALVAWALLFLAPGLVALATLEVVSRAFYAMEDTRTPVLAGGLQLAAMALLAYVFSHWIFPALGWAPLGGIALGVSVANLLETAFLLWLLRRKMGGVAGRHLLDGLWRMGIASGLMAGTAWLAQEQTAGMGLGALWQALVGGAAGGGIYLMAAQWLKVAELRQLVGYARRRLPWTGAKGAK